MAQPIQGKIGNKVSEGTFTASEYTGKNGTTSVIVELLANGGKSAVWTSQGRLADIMPKAIPAVSNKTAGTPDIGALVAAAVAAALGGQDVPKAKPGRPTKRDLVK